MKNLSEIILAFDSVYRNGINSDISDLPEDDFSNLYINFIYSLREVFNLDAEKIISTVREK